MNATTAKPAPFGISAVPCKEPANAVLTTRQTSLLAGLAFFSFLVLLSIHHIADGDLWAKLSLGASVWLRHEIPMHDTLAFTPVLPKYIDHEWGAGVVFFGILKCLGPSGLMLLKVGLFFLGLTGAALAARKRGVTWTTLFLLVLPCGFCIWPSYIPTVRSHAFTFASFGLLLWFLEEFRDGKAMFGFFAVLLIGLWANLHGGFVAGLGAVFIYGVEGIFLHKRVKQFALLGLAAGLVTFCNPYGLDFWRYLIPAILHPRAQIEEWRALPLFGADYYIGFRVLFFLMLGVLAWWGLRGRKTRDAQWSVSGLALLAITAFLGWKSRRHGSFLGIAALAYGSIYAQAALSAIASRIDVYRAILGLHGILALGLACFYFPHFSWNVLAPVGHDPVREADILSQSGLSGNVAVPFAWGSYASWRLYPNIKISHDGRYEAAYPESTFELNNAFFEKRGSDWDRLIREYPVDFIIIDLQHERVLPEDLARRGYMLVWEQPEVSALMALEKHAATLRATVQNLPPYTINPLDASIPEQWWK
jgi:hypothetical protein